jgi:uncharacterized protein DUF4157/protein-glutamine gamma-glutamyltransferase-like protein
MRTFAQNLKAQQTTAPESMIPSRARLGEKRQVYSILHLQSTIGNQAVQRLLKSKPDGSEAVADATASGRFGHDFSQIPVHPRAPVKIQSKLAVSTPGDIYEEEADRVSEQVMQMHDPEAGRKPTWTESACSSCGDEVAEIAQVETKPLGGSLARWIQRQIGNAEIEDELVKTLVAAGATVERQVDEPEAGQKDEEEERLMRARAAGGPTHQAATDLTATIHSLEGGGQPLPSSVRNFMDPRFGHDFSHVRVHTDANADEAAQAVNARAFTIGRNVAFAVGQYAPETSTGQRLLAHELTHVVQQGYQSSRIQRKIIIGGKPYIPTAKYYDYLGKNFGANMQEFVKNMHNDGKPPDFTFTSPEQMGYEVRVRNQALKGIDEAHAEGCDYPDSTHPAHLDSTYWDKVGPMQFKPKSPLPVGKGASDAIEAIFAPGAGTRLECMSMTFAVEYYSLLKGLGKDKFNALFPAGVGIEISTEGTSSALFRSPKPLYKVVAVSSKSEILPGDWVYFKNFKDFLVKHPGENWQGENAIYMGGGNYRGFGVSSMKEADLNAELVKHYNAGLPVGDHKTVADLLREGGGLLLTPVARPDIAKLAP